METMAWFDCADCGVPTLGKKGEELCATCKEREEREKERLGK